MRRIGLVIAFVAGCGTDAEGVSECRVIERARCQAAVSCGYPNVEECERFARDQCLHGVALETVGATELDACAADLGRAGRCAAEQGSETPANACSDPVQTGAPPPSACQVVLRPELASSCAILVAGASASAPSAAPSDGGS